jgi:hypothetical protein
MRQTRTLNKRLAKLEAATPAGPPHHAVQIFCESEEEGEAKIAAMRAAGEIFPHTQIIQIMFIHPVPRTIEGTPEGLDSGQVAP